MKPIPFKESNKTLLKPPTMTEKECGPLAVFTNGVDCVSCWRPTWAERFSVLFHGRVWALVRSGITQPPILLLGSRTCFKKERP